MVLGLTRRDNARQMRKNNVLLAIHTIKSNAVLSEILVASVLRIDVNARIVTNSSAKLIACRITE